MDRFIKKQSFKKTDTFKKLSTINPADKKSQKTQSMLTLALLLEVLQKKSQKKAAIELCTVFYLSKVIALSFCLLL